MPALIDAAISRSRTVLFMLLVMIVTGLITYIQIPKEGDAS